MTAEWKSPNKIIARTGQAKGKGDIIVVTRSGGVGTCTVVFRGYYIQTGECPIGGQVFLIKNTVSMFKLMYQNDYVFRLKTF